MDEEIELVRFPTEEEDFVNDERISLDRVTQSYKLEDEKGNEWEWLEKPRKWVPVVRTSQIPVRVIDRLWPACMAAP